MLSSLKTYSKFGKVNRSFKAGSLGQLIRQFDENNFRTGLIGNICLASFHDLPSPPNKGEHPFKRFTRIFKDEVKNTTNKLNDPFGEYQPRSIFPSYCDIVIIGGGVMGSSIAYWLQQRALDGLRVVVVEKDPSVKLNFENYLEYKSASTVLSCGGLRQQFSLAENVQMSLFGAEFLRKIGDHLSVPGEDPPNVNFNPCGYLFLASEKGVDILKENYKLQTSLGAKCELLTVKKLKQKFPWLNTDGIELGSHGLENEGWFDPWSLLHALRMKAGSLGTEFVIGEAVNFEFERVQHITVDQCEEGQYHGTNRINVRTEDGDVKSINFALCIIAAGAESGKVAELANIGTGTGKLKVPMPIERRKRYVFNFHCPDGPGLNTPFIIDPTGTYIRRDGLGGNYICGCCPPPGEEPPTSDLEVDHQFFEDKIWPVIANRVPAFENIKVKSSWAGYYDYNFFDENGIIGPHPAFTNMYIASGFSGHGLQQAPAVGRAIMELIVDGRFTTIDLTRLSVERVLNNEPVYETNIV